MTQDYSTAVMEINPQVIGLKDIYKDRIDNLQSKAKTDPRKRVLELLGIEERGQEKYQRMINALDRDTYARPHMHANENCVETFQSMKGKAYIVFFDEEGGITDVQTLDEETENIVEIPAFTNHTLIAETDCVLYEEMKQPADLYDVRRDKTEAQWSPGEFDKEGNINPDGHTYLRELRERVLDFQNKTTL